MKIIKKLIIIGNGGHSQVVQSVVKQTKQFQLLEVWDDIFQEDKIISGIRYKPLSTHRVISSEAIRYFIAIGDNPIRRRIEKKLNLSVSDYATIIHPKAIVDEQSTIKEGSLIMANAVIQTNSVIGYHSIINTSAVVEHDTVIGNFVHVAPNATITGNCSLADYVFLGANGVLVPNINIGKNSVIGAGSVVTRSIPQNVVAYGNPAKIV